MAAEGEKPPALPAAISGGAQVSALDQAAYPTAEECFGTAAEESREAKRRKTCPAALEKLSPSTAAETEAETGRGGEGCGFSFDTMRVLPIETTPKFGSFNCSADLGLGTVAGGEKTALGGIKEEAEGEDGKEDEGGAGSSSGPAEGKIGI